MSSVAFMACASPACASWRNVNTAPPHPTPCVVRKNTRAWRSSRRSHLKHHYQNKKNIINLNHWTTHPFQSQNPWDLLSRPLPLDKLEEKFRFFANLKPTQIWGWMRENQSYRHSRFDPVNGWILKWFAQRHFGFTGTCHFLLLEESSPENFIMKRTLCEDPYPEMSLKGLSHTYLLWFSTYIHPWSWAWVAVLALTYIMGTFSLLEFAGRRDRFYFWDWCCSWMLLLRGTTYKKASPINLSHRLW